MGENRKPNEMEGALLFDEDDEGGDERGSAGHAGDGKAEEALEFVRGILSRMGLNAHASIREDGARVVIDISGPDAGRAIGKKGTTLDALQFLVNKVVNRFPERRRHIVIDSGDYRERHDQNLLSLARREAQRAIDTGRIVTLEPMPARDRRLIHLSLAKLPGVSTKSNGEGLGRRIQIIPARLSSTNENSRRDRDRRRGGGSRPNRPENTSTSPRVPSPSEKP